MRIAYISDERFPCTETDTQQVAMTVDALAEAGVDITLLPPAFPEGPYANNQTEALRDYYGTEHNFSVQLVRTVSPERRAIVKPLHALKATRMLRKEPPDLVYCRNLPVAIAALWRGFPVMFESYRIIDGKYPRLSRIFGRMCRSSRFLGVITHSSVSAESFARAGVPNEKIRVIHNGFDPRTMTPHLEKTAAREKCKLPIEGRLAVYTGHINSKKGVDVLATLAADTPEVTHVWVGGDTNGSTHNARALIEQHNLTNVILPGWVVPGELPPYLYAADVLLIPATELPLKMHGNTVLPMKLFTYLAAGRPILAPDLPDSREILQHDGNAWLIPPDVPAAAAEGLMSLLDDPSLAARLGDQARQDSLGHTWSARGVQILHFLKERSSALQGDKDRIA